MTISVGRILLSSFISYRDRIEGRREGGRGRREGEEREGGRELEAL